MENVKYILGDLVRSNNNPKITWKVKDVSQDKMGNVLYRLIAVGEEEAFIYLYEPQIASIPLTPAILKANGWKSQNGTAYFLDVTEGYIPYIDIDFKHKTNDGKLLVEVYNKAIVEIEFIHQLQHLLFGLGLPSELKI